MRGEGRGGSKTVVNKYASFLSLTFSKIFTRQDITLVKMNGAELKLKGRKMNIKQIICRQFSKRNLSIFGNYCQCQCDGNLDLCRIYKEKHLLWTKSFVVLQ